MRKQADSDSPYSMGLAAGGKAIRSWLRDVMIGATPLDQVPEQWREMVASMMQLPIHRLAVNVLSSTHVDARRAALARIPDSIRPLVEAEARKLFAARRK